MASPIFVSLTAAEAPEDRGYDLRIGPMWFTWPIAPIGETFGDGLEAVGAAIVAAERRPRPLKLTIPVRASDRSLRPTRTGLEMRAQVRQLLDNARWRLSGLYVWFSADSDINGWYMIGGGDLTESDPGLSFGDFELELTDVYLVARPGTHKPGRRLELGDRRSGLVPRDTRQRIFTTDFAEVALPTEPLVLPGDIVNVLGAGGRTPASSTDGPVVGGRRLWRTVAAVAGEAASYLPDDAILHDPAVAYRDLDDPGQVRVWSLEDASPYPPNPVAYSPERAQDPTLDGWRAVYGDMITSSTRLAMDNGACRVVWLGPGSDEGLALERADGSGGYARVARVVAGLNVREARVIELTPERAVLEWRGGARAMRAILQRGWYGPRLEAYDDNGGLAALEFTGDDGLVPLRPPIVDPFNRPNENPLANGWLAMSSALQLTGNEVVGPTSTAGGYRTDIVLADVMAGVTITDPADAASTPSASLWLRGAGLADSGSRSGYRVLWFNSNTHPEGSNLTLYRYNGDGSATTLLSIADYSLPRLAAGMELIARICGSKLEAFIDGALVGTATDTGITAPGYVALTLSMMHADNFAAGPSLPGDSHRPGAAILGADVIDSAGDGLIVARGTAADTLDIDPQYIAGSAAVCYRRTGALVVQVDVGPQGDPEPLVARGLVDAQSVPVLLSR